MGVSKGTEKTSYGTYHIANVRDEGYHNKNMCPTDAPPHTKRRALRHIYEEDWRGLLVDDDYVERLVAFVDILGFRRYVFEVKDKAKETIRLIDEVLSHSVSIVKDLNVNNLFSFKLFSDCICMSTNLDNTHEMLYELAFMQGWFAINGIFVRGALSCGLHYENENMIFSEGLIRAYEHEKNAIYPRITIDPILLDAISNSDTVDFLMKAPDGASPLITSIFSWSRRCLMDRT